MRWFIEVSRIGEGRPLDQFCLEAKQWQAALQEARRLRSDTGPLSKFSIELLEGGYRAVDPGQQIRYVVKKAPDDAPLSPAPSAEKSAGAPSTPPATSSKVPSVAPAPMIKLSRPHPEAVPATDPMGSPPMSEPLKTDPMAVPLRTEPMAAPTPLKAPSAPPPQPAPAKTPSVVPAPMKTPSVAPAPAKTPSVVPPRPALIVPDDPVPAAPMQPEAAASRPAPNTTLPMSAAAPTEPAPTAPPATAPPVTGSTAPSSPPAAASKPSAAPSHQATQRSIPAARAPTFELVRKREQEPTDQSPIVYREAAYAVAPDTSPEAAEVLLWLRFREVVASIHTRSERKFVQLAVFDHAFETKPQRPPLATLMWKDWRGDPIVQFPSASQTPPPVAVTGAPPAVTPPPAAAAPSRPASSTAGPSTSASSASAPTASAPAAAPAPAASAPAPTASAPSAPAPAPTASAPSAPAPAPAASAPSAPAPAPAASAPSAPAPSAPEASAPATVPSAPPPPPSTPASAAPGAFPAAPSPSAVRSEEAAPQPAAKPAAPPATNAPEAPAPKSPSKPPSQPPTGPALRRAREDLIGELFEAMHDLHFAPDMVTGVDFVLGILNRTLPSEAIMIHVFDINRRQFVVVRALGPSPQAVVLQRTPDTDVLFRRAMRSTRATCVQDTTDNTSYVDGRWGLLGVKPKTAIIGSVQLHGRYLGAIELANPYGGEPYSEHEAHALDYICEQLAEFLAQRPIVVDADVVLGKS